MRLEQQVIVVTGGGSGIGRAVAIACAGEGAHVVVVGRTRAPLVEVARRTKGVAIVADVTREEDTERVAREVLETWGRVDGLVNNAGAAESASFPKTDRAFWDRMIAVNATSVFLMSRAFLPELVKSRGRLVVVASIAGKVGAPYIAAYAASKHAALGVMRSLAAEYAQTGMRVNAVCPGYVDTSMTDRAVENIVARTGRDAAAVRQMLAGQNASKRILQASEVAEAIVTLLLPECPRNGEAIDLQ